MRRHFMSSKKPRSYVSHDPRYNRPTEVDLLLGDASKARRELGYAPIVSREQGLAELRQSARAA
jgi:GDPmannose 4,6-dehydratase